MPEGKILERFLDERRAAARIACAPTLIPAPGQYLLAHDPASDAPLAVPVFSAGSFADGFIAAPPLPRDWIPGLTLSLRGPLGRGFHLPPSARRVALAALDASPSLLFSLLTSAFAQDASVALACDSPPDDPSIAKHSGQDLPADLEIHPLAALVDLFSWADYAALVVPRASLSGLRERLGRADQHKVTREAQLLIIAPMPCGGLAACGVCSVDVKRGNRLVCEDGPVFDLVDFL